MNPALGHADASPYDFNGWKSPAQKMILAPGEPENEPIPGGFDDL